jgi:hypothetical protein
LGFLKEDILSFFFWLPWLPEVYGIEFFEQYLKVTTKGPFL